MYTDDSSDRVLIAQLPYLLKTKLTMIFCSILLVVGAGKWPIYGFQSGDILGVLFGLITLFVLAFTVYYTAVVLINKVDILAENDQLHAQSKPLPLWHFRQQSIPLENLVKTSWKETKGYKNSTQYLIEAHYENGEVLPLVFVRDHEEVAESVSQSIEHFFSTIITPDVYGEK